MIGRMNVVVMRLRGKSSCHTGRMVLLSSGRRQESLVMVLDQLLSIGIGHGLGSFGQHSLIGLNTRLLFLLGMDTSLSSFLSCRDNGILLLLVHIVSCVDFLVVVLVVVVVVVGWSGSPSKESHDGRSVGRFVNKNDDDDFMENDKKDSKSHELGRCLGSGQEVIYNTALLVLRERETMVG